MIKLSREDAEKSIAAVQAEIDAGHSFAHHNGGGLTAIAIASRKLKMAPGTLRSRVQPGGSCERHFGLTLRLTEEDSAAFESQEKAASASRGELGFDPIPPGYEIKSTAQEYDAEGFRGKSWIKQTRAHGEAFEMPEGQVVKGVSALLDGEGRIIAKWVKTKSDNNDAEWLDAIREALTNDIQPIEPIPAPRVSDTDLLTLYPVADLHVGMYAWAQETGEDCDLELIEKLFLSKISTIIDRSPAASNAVILNVGDFFHSDFRSNRTEHSGHILDVDSRWTRVLRVGVNLFRATIELALRKHRHVTVRSLPGNHDYHSSQFLAVAMDCFFHNDPRVTIDMDPSKFWFHQFGKNLFSATHGDNARLKEMPGIVAAMAPQMWGETLHRFCFMGHLHHAEKITSEMNGMQAEIFRTIAPRDFYNASMGYCAGRSLVGITYHRESGEESRVIESVPPIFRRAA